MNDMQFVEIKQNQERIYNITDITHINIPDENMTRFEITVKDGGSAIIYLTDETIDFNMYNITDEIELFKKESSRLKVEDYTAIEKIYKLGLFGTKYIDIFDEIVEADFMIEKVHSNVRDKILNINDDCLKYNMNKILKCITDIIKSTKQHAIESKAQFDSNLEVSSVENDTRNQVCN